MTVTYAQVGVNPSPSTGGATELATTTDPVVVSDADAPAEGQVLTATSATTAEWQTPSHTPDAHASTHKHGGSDEVATATAGANAIPKAGAGGTLAIGWIPVGTSSGTVTAGNDSRLSDARTPTSHAASHQNGGSDEIATATAAANAIPKAGAGGTLAIGWIPTGTTSSTVAVGNDSRLSDSRTPTTHATSHQHGGSDEIATATAAANAIPKAGAGGTLAIGWIPTGTTSSTVAIGNDARLSDARTPTAHATSHKSGGSDAIKLDELGAPTDVTTLNARPRLRTAFCAS